MENGGGLIVEVICYRLLFIPTVIGDCQSCGNPTLIRTISPEIFVK
jgi:hypothetical protein